MLKKLLLLTLIASLIVTSFWGGNASANNPELYTSITNARSRQGLPALVPDGVLEAKAVAWSQQMAANGFISHSVLPDGITHQWKSLGENVGVGGSVEQVAQALIDSPSHYANIINPAFTHVGVGAVFDGSRYWVTQVFMELAQTPVPKPVPIVVSTLPPTTIPPPPPTTVTVPPPTEPPPPPPPETTTTVAPSNEEKATAVIKRTFTKFVNLVHKIMSFFRK